MVLHRRQPPGTGQGKIVPRAAQLRPRMHRAGSGQLVALPQCLSHDITLCVSSAPSPIPKEPAQEARPRPPPQTIPQLPCAPAPNKKLLQVAPAAACCCGCLVDVAALLLVHVATLLLHVAAVAAGVGHVRPPGPRPALNVAAGSAAIEGVVASVLRVVVMGQGQKSDALWAPRHPQPG